MNAHEAPTGRSVTEQILRYRLCCLDLWNKHIRAKVVNPEHEFINIRMELLRAFLSDTSATYDLAAGETNIFFQCSAGDYMTKRIDAGQWTTHRHNDASTGVQWAMIDFFDFADSSDVAIYQYIRGYNQSSELEALADYQDVQFFYGDRMFPFR